MWIRSPSWDAFWMLSGIPIGAALVLAAPSVHLTLLAIVLLEHAHFLSPIALAWGHSGLRRMALGHPLKFIGVPVAIILATTTIGVLTSALADLHIDIGMKVKVYDTADYKQPFVMMVVLYWFWNAFHFGMQNFGVLSIYRAKSGSGNRRADMIYCLVVQAAASVLLFVSLFGVRRADMLSLYVALAVASATWMMLWETKLSPRILFILTDSAGLALIFWSGLWGFAIWSLNHWLVAIGLSGHVFGRGAWRRELLFVAGLVGAGMVVFWLVFGSGVNIDTLFDPRFVVTATMVAMSVRYGVAFTHFLYDRWLWQFSNPEIRATIGKAFAAPVPTVLTKDKRRWLTAN
jgi:hypothetical protein